MTLDERIEKDLTELYNNGEIVAAHDLSIKMFGSHDGFSAYGKPGHFAGNRDAYTVMVMLNPGKDVAAANNPIKTHNLLCDLGIKTNTLKEFIRTYKEASMKFGEKDFDKAINPGKYNEKYCLDNFDIKQAAFLKHWEDCEVKIPDPFPTKDDISLRQEVKKNVLMQKLQLELVPYASRTFEVKDDKLELLFPFVETLFDEIFRKEDRRYVIFCSAYFKKLFEIYNKDDRYPGWIKIGQTETGPSILKNGVSCTPIRIYRNGKEKCPEDVPSLKAVIAHTFPNQALPNAYSLMEKYGEFCYRVFKDCKL